MKFMKKEQLDVKKFMEEIKANKTNRSYTSINQRNHQGDYMSKISIRSPEHQIGRGSSLQSHHFGYNPNHNHMNSQHIYNPNPYQPQPQPQPRQLNQYGITPHSQIFTPSPYPQLYSMMNYSQTFNSPIPDPYYDHNFGVQTIAYSQIPSQIQQKYNPTPIPLQVSHVTEGKGCFMNNEPVEKIGSYAEKGRQGGIGKKEGEEQMGKKEGVASIESMGKRAGVEKIRKEGINVGEQKIAKRKRRGRQKKITTSPKQILQNIPIQSEKKTSQKPQQEPTFSISKKFDQTLLAQKLKIQSKLRQQLNFKSIMSHFNNKIDKIGQNYFPHHIQTNILNFKLKFIEGEQYMLDNTFEDSIKEFEDGILIRINELS